MKRSSFTLIELLLVVAIIAILMSILLPSVSKARAVAMASVCLSNEKQMGIGVSMYENDFDSRFPPRNHNIHAIYWLGTLMDHESSPRVLNAFLSSSDVVEVAKCPGDIGESSKYDHVGTSYLANVYLPIAGWTSLAIDSSTSVNSHEVKSPAKMITMSETGAQATVADYGESGRNYHSIAYQKYTYNVLFADGHVQKVSGFKDGLVTTDSYTLDLNSN